MKGFLELNDCLKGCRITSIWTKAAILAALCGRTENNREESVGIYNVIMAADGVQDLYLISKNI